MRKRTKRNKQGSGFRVQGSTRFLSPDPCTLTPEKGFTLIELLVTASILGLIGLGILSTFGSGLHVYERVQSYGGVQTDVLLALEEMEKNIRNIFLCSSIRINGEAQRMSFPALIEKTVTEDDKDQITASIGEIAYFLDELEDETKVLASEQRDYSQAVAENDTEEVQTHILAAIKDIKFNYYSYDEANEEYIWQESLIPVDPVDPEDPEKKKPPVGVKIELTFEDGTRDVQLVRTVFIPSIPGAPKKTEGK